VLEINGGGPWHGRCNGLLSGTQTGRTREKNNIMKTKHLLALLVMCCVVAAFAGCASTDRQMSESSLDDKNLAREEALSSTGSSQPVILDERAFPKLDLDTNGAIFLDEWRHFETNTVAKENFNTPDQNDDVPINVTEFLTQTPKPSTLYPVLGDAEQINNDHFFWDQEQFQPQGLRFFSFRF